MVHNHTAENNNTVWVRLEPDWPVNFTQYVWDMKHKNTCDKMLLSDSAFIEQIDP